MISIGSIVLILMFHFCGDFLAQTDWMAIHKSANWGLNEAMSWHITSYALTFIVGMMVTGLPGPVAWWIALNSVAHYATDAVTSNATSYLWKRNERHWFFAVIGLDQLIHVLTLLITWHWIVGS